MILALSQMLLISALRMEPQPKLSVTDLIFDLDDMPIMPDGSEATTLTTTPSFPLGYAVEKRLEKRLWAPGQQEYTGHIAFSHIPKTGGTFIEHFLHTRGIDVGFFGHLDASVRTYPWHVPAAEFVGTADESYFRRPFYFAVTREPYARVASAMHYIGHWELIHNVSKPIMSGIEFPKDKCNIGGYHAMPMYCFDDEQLEKHLRFIRFEMFATDINAAIENDHSLSDEERDALVDLSLQFEAGHGIYCDVKADSDTVDCFDGSLRQTMQPSLVRHINTYYGEDFKRFGYGMAASGATE